MFQINERESFLKLVISQLSQIIIYLLETIKKVKSAELELKYRIEDQTTNSFGVFYYKVLIVGTGKIITRTPEFFLQNSEYLDDFSKSDVMTIINRANFEKYLPQTKISSILYEDNLIKFKDVNQVETSKSGETLSSLNQENLNFIVENLSNKDAFKLGLFLGEQTT